MFSDVARVPATTLYLADVFEDARYAFYARWFIRPAGISLFGRYSSLTAACLSQTLRTPVRPKHSVYGVRRYGDP